MQCDNISIVLKRDIFIGKLRALFAHIVTCKARSVSYFVFLLNITKNIALQACYRGVIATSDCDAVTFPIDTHQNCIFLNLFLS